MLHAVLQVSKNSVDEKYLLVHSIHWFGGALFDGVTICKKSGIKKPSKKPLPQELIDSWSNVKTVIVDEVTFMKRSKFDKLDRRLC